jgi:hypothetical protein
MLGQMKKVQESAADNDTLEDGRVDIMKALVIAHESCRGDDVDQCIRFVKSVTALARFLGFRNALDERVKWGEAALPVAERLKDYLAIAELCASTISWPLLQQGRHKEAESYCHRGLEAARKCKDTAAAAKWAGNAARTLSGIARDDKDASAAYYWAEQAAIYAQSCNDQTLIRGAELDFGYTALLRGDFFAAENRFRALLELEERGKDEERIGNRSLDVSLAIMNRVIQSEDSSERIRLCGEARALIERDLYLGKKINHQVMVGEGEISLAILERILGKGDEYRRLLASGMRRFVKLGILRPGRAEQFVVFPDTNNT